jgi:magnesium-transporting ATPase (P-type)
MSKTLLGVAFILLAIPYVNVVGLILVPIGWILLGRKAGKGLWTATGIVGLLGFIMVIAAVAMIGGALMGAMGGGIGMLPALGMAALAVLVIAIVLLVIFGILNIASVWSASNYYREGLLKAAAILWIILVIIGIAMAGMMVAAMAGGAPGMLGGGVFVLLIGVGIINLIANILAGIGFLKAKEPTAIQPQPPPVTYAPPPPPPPQ